MRRRQSRTKATSRWPDLVTTDRVSTRACKAFEPFDKLVEGLQRGATYEDIRGQFESEQLPSVYRERKLVLFPDDAEVWSFLLRIFDYDPRAALERIRVPVLGLFGADDLLVPVGASVTVYQEAAQPELLSVAVFPGADHRMHTGDPSREVVP